MNTIKQIISDNWYTIEQLKKCKHCNGCWPKKHNFFKYLPKFDNSKFDKLKQDMNLICNIHDDMYYKGWNIFDFLKANYILWENIMRLAHWTNLTWRIIIFFIFFLGTTLWGFRYFNWK